MSDGRDLLVLGFGDPAAQSIPQLQPSTLAALAPSAAACVLVDDDWATDGAARLEALAALAETRPRLICLGVGAGGYGALYFGRLLGASAIFAAAPGAGSGRLFGADDLEDLGALFSDADLAPAGQYLRILTADDSLTMDLAIIDRLQKAAANVTVDHASLPIAAIPLALAQSGMWAEQIGAWIEGAPTPGAGDLATTWRQAFAHTLEVDTEQAYQDIGGALHLSGRLLNRSRSVFDLTMASAERVRIGARLRSRDGDRRVLDEARAGFAATRLQPDQSSPFRLSFPGLPQDAGAIEIALVCEDCVWFDTVGFPLITLDWGASPDPAPEADDLRVAAAPNGSADPSTQKIGPAAAVPKEAV